MLPTEMKSTPVSAIVADAVQRHAARGFELQGPRGAAVERDGLAHVREREIVEQGDIRAGVDGLLAVRRGFRLRPPPAPGVPVELAGATARAMEPAAMMWFSLMRIPSNRPMR